MLNFLFLSTNLYLFGSSNNTCMIPMLWKKKSTKNMYLTLKVFIKVEVNKLMIIREKINSFYV